MEISFPLCIFKLPGIPKEKMSHSLLYSHKDRAQLEASLDAGSQFRRLDWRGLLERRGDQLRIVLISPQDYYAAQAAAHLTALDWITHKYPGFSRPSRVPESLLSDVKDLSRSLTLLDVSVLDPSLKEDPTAWPEKPVRLTKLNTPAVLIRGASRVVTDGVLEQIEDTFSHSPLTPPTHIFLSLRPEQADPAMLNKLQYHYFFQIGLVDTPDLPYLAQVLQYFTTELMPTAKNINWERLVRHVQSICGDSFTERDLSALPTLAVLNRVPLPATEEDLAVNLFDSACLPSANTSHF